MFISRTPFRFSLIGGGSDLPAYYKEYGPAKIISMTLGASMYVTYSPRDLYSDPGALGSPIRLSYTQTENVNSISAIQHDLIRGVLESLRDDAHLKLPFSFEMTTVADIPSRGAGLGSSSALVVGILKILYSTPPSPDDANVIAWYAYDIESRILGRPVGFQDHYSAAIGGLRKYHTIDDGYNSVKYSAVRNQRGSELASHLIAFRLPVNRSSNTAKMPEHQTLDAMKEDMRNRADDLTFTVDMVDNMWECLRCGDFLEVGRILDKAWYYKKKSHGVLDNNIDRLYNIGVSKGGALGGKVSGSMSGGAGHLFFLAYPDEHERIRKALKELVEMKVEYYPHGSTVTRI